MEEIERREAEEKTGGKTAIVTPPVEAGFPALAVLFSPLYVVFNPQDTGKH